jgi:hypothetical protein
MIRTYCRACTSAVLWDDRPKPRRADGLEQGWHQYRYVVLDDRGYAPVPSPAFSSDPPLYDLMAEYLPPIVIDIAGKFAIPTVQPTYSPTVGIEIGRRA